jgi:ribosomal protein S18 acetylase RimI-like enzyme
MPKVRRRQLPSALLRHLLERAAQRQISYDQLQDLYRWLSTDPIVPAGKWFKQFGGFTLCGEGELVKTFLIAGQLPTGEEIH